MLSILFGLTWCEIWSVVLFSQDACVWVCRQWQSRAMAAWGRWSCKPFDMEHTDEHYIGNSKRVPYLWLIFIQWNLWWCLIVLITVLFVCLFRLAYLHEGLEPKVVHRDVKSSNILIDRQWNPKVSDFGLAKLLSADHSYVTTRVMGTFGLVWFN